MPLSEHIPDSKTRGAFYIYLPIAAVIVNMFYIGNPVVGMVAGSFFLALAGHLLYRRFLMDGFGSISTTGVVLGSLMFLFFLSAVSSVFVIFYNFPPQAIAALLIASGIPLSFLGVKYWSSWRFPLSAREWLTKISVMDLKSAVLFSTALAVLIADIALLLPYKMELPAKVWSLIPMEHIYLVIALTLLTSIAIVGKFNVKVKFAVVLIHGFVLQAYVPLVVSTQFGGDTWYMMGEVIHALDPKSNYLVDRFSDPAFPTIRILGMNFPESLLTGWARGVANSLAVFFVEIFQLKIYESWVWIGPLVWLFSSKIILYRLGKKISSNEHFPLLLALGFSFFSTLLARGLFTAKITVSFPLFLLALLIWMWYIVDGNRKARNLALLFTAISFFGYSLFALVLISIGIAAILIRNRDRIFSFIPNTPIARYAVIGLLSVFMILLVPMADNAYGSRFKITSPNDTMFFFLEYTGFLGPVGGSFPINSWFTTLEWFAFSQVALWALFVYGVVRRNNIVPRQVHLALVWICAIVFLSFYIDINFMTAPHAVGNYLRSLVDLFRLPLVIIGIINVVDYIRAAKAKAEGKTFSSLKRDVLDMFASRALLVILFIILITSAHTIETGTLWLPQSDVLAAQYIAKTPEKYVVISNFENTFPVYAFTGGEIDGGGFPTTVILGTATDIPTLSYYRNIIAPGSSPEDILRHAASAAGTCSVYVLFPATYQNPDLFNKLSSIASSPRTFDADATSTLFKFGGIDRSGAPPRLGDLNVVVGRTDFDPVTRQLISEVVLQNNRCDIPLVVGLKWTVMDSYRVLGTVEEVIELKPFETKRVGSSFPVNNGANYQVAVEAFNLDNTAYASVPEGPRYIQIHVQDEQGNPVPATISG
ncbi:hypothetical protein, partial [Nitrososphaera sp.]|uniref:hypothetical protein n=1 Tax=Nitrososphaera sp. TaxID=1971748 RepID=UPI00307F2082